MAAIVSGDPGGDALPGIDGLAKCGSVLRGIFGGHVADPQMIEAFFGHREADQPAAILGHEINGFGRDLFGGQGQIAFVLAIFVVDDHDHSALADVVDGGHNVGER